MRRNDHSCAANMSTVDQAVQDSIPLLSPTSHIHCRKRLWLPELIAVERSVCTSHEALEAFYL